VSAPHAHATALAAIANMYGRVLSTDEAGAEIA
jgi:hypothetical protein